MTSNNGKDILAARNDDDEEEEIRRLDAEIKLVRKMRLAFASVLGMLERSRDDLKFMEHQMEQAQVTSRHCRELMEEQQRKNSGDEG